MHVIIYTLGISKANSLCDIENTLRPDRVANISCGILPSNELWSNLEGRGACVGGGGGVGVKEGGGVGGCK
jgi:hypothetical protein